MTSKLEPCFRPGCDGVPRAASDFRGFACVTCPECGLTTGFYLTKTLAREDWNRRQTETPHD